MKFSRRTLLFFSFLALMAIVLIIAVVVSGKDTKINLTLAIEGETKAIAVVSDVGGDLGTYYADTVRLQVLKSKQTIIVRSQGYSDETFTIDATKKSQSIKISLTPISETVNALGKITGVSDVTMMSDCGYFALKSWASCRVSYEDFSEIIIMKKTGDAWKFIAGGSNITSEDLDDTDAPQELKDYLGY